MILIYSMMKKIITIFWIAIFAASVYGQKTVESILKARALRETGNPDLAIEILSGAISQVNESRLFTERADAKISKGDYSGAMADYNEANRITPYAGEYGLSRIYALKGDAAAAVNHLGLSMKSAGRKSEKEIMLDPAFGAVENKPEWRKFWQNEWYTPSEKSISEIEYYNSLGRSDEARNILSEMRNNNSGNNDIIYAESLINLSQGRYSEVTRLIPGLLALSPGNEKYLRVLARAQYGSSNFAGASVTYSHLIDMGIPDADLYLQRAECYRKTGEVKTAMADIDKYLEIYPESKSGLSMAGKTALQSGDNLKALEFFSRNVKLHPNDAECYVDRANSYFAARSWDWAVNDYSMSLDLNPGNPETWLYKGMALLNSGKRDEACHDFRKSLNLGNKRASEYISSNCFR
jgi:tetratricopeptide (TPR) repeat protein